jgi:RNA 3'-terminal phosphate cyclase (ATP)
MIEIDGSNGEGGGQIVRSSLALSAITGKPFRIFNIRAGRKKPGLKRQHLACVKAAAEICDASAAGAELESDELVFVPTKLKSGEFHFRISTAGSAPLVAQTVLPALMLADGPSKIIVEGGTHNPMAPCFDYLKKIYLPLVQKMGPKFESELLAHGFYPAGGGKFEIAIEPAKQLDGIELLERSQKFTPHIIGIVSQLPVSIAQREVDTILRKMQWKKKQSEIVIAKNPKGPGNAVLIEINSQELSEMFVALGKRGVPAEKVATSALKDAKRYLVFDNCPVGEHLADQLMLPMGLAAASGKTSRFKTVPLTEHSRTHKTVLQRFLDVSISFEEQTDGTALVVISPQD